MVSNHFRGTADSHVTQYRPDIDGIRAVAVLSVIAFHVSSRFLQGGYLGVDIFFVLSGYLITNIIWREAQAGTFTVRRFYDRRIRRIVPALFVMLMVASVLAAALLLSVDLTGYAKSLAATLAFVANIYFWRDTDYFSRLAEEKPLLHVWSLSVEEQFYILFPLLIIVVVKRGRQVVLCVLGILVVASLIMDFFFLRRGAPAPAFFLLPTRAWEMGIGALLPLQGQTAHWRRVPRELVAAGCVALILFGLTSRVSLIAGMVPPALLVVTATALLILIGSRGGSWVNTVLSWPAAVGIGLVSYSLYLWHWPILVFSRYYLVRDLHPGELTAALGLMALAAILSWKYVERPFRDRSVPTRTVLVWSASGSGLLLVFALLALAGRGWPHRFPPEAARMSASADTAYRCSISDFVPIGASRGCALNLPAHNVSTASVALFGNSHALMYGPVVKQILEEQIRQGVLIWINSCLPTPSVNISADCLRIARTTLVTMEQLPEIRTVILATTWDQAVLTEDGVTPVQNHDAALARGLDGLIDELLRSGHKVVLVGPLAVPGWDVASITARDLAFHHPLSDKLYRNQTDFDASHGAILRHFAERNDIVLIRPDQVQCVTGQCEFTRNGVSIFADSDHLAQAALPLFHDVFAQGLMQAFRSSSH